MRSTHSRPPPPPPEDGPDQGLRDVRIDPSAGRLQDREIDDLVFGEVFPFREIQESVKALARIQGLEIRGRNEGLQLGFVKDRDGLGFAVAGDVLGRLGLGHVEAAPDIAAPDPAYPEEPVFDELQAFRLGPWEIVLTHRELSRMIGDNTVAKRDG